MNLCSNKNNSNDDADKKYNADHGDDDGNHSDHEIISTMTIIITTVAMAMAMQGRSQRGVPGGPTPLSVLPQYNTHWYGLSTRIEHFSIKTITCPPLPPSPLQGKILAKPLQWQRQ